MDSKITAFKIKGTVVHFQLMEMPTMALLNLKDTQLWVAQLQLKVTVVHQLAHLQLKDTVAMSHHQPTKVDALISKKEPISLPYSATELSLEIRTL